MIVTASSGHSPAAVSARQHHGIGPVIDRIGNVGDFGAGRCGAFDHAFQHLRGHDHRLAQLRASLTMRLLQWRHFFGQQLHAQIAARDHHSVGQFDDFVEALTAIGFSILAHSAAVIRPSAGGLRPHLRAAARRRGRSSPHPVRRRR